MGYNPFRPHMSAAGNAPAGPVTAAAAAAADRSALQSSDPRLPPAAPAPTSPAVATAAAPPVAAAATGVAVDVDVDASETPADDEEIDEWVADVDDAFAMLLSLGTMLQMLLNLALTEWQLLLMLLCCRSRCCCLRM